MNLPVFDTIDVNVSIKRDTQGRRVPSITITMPASGLVVLSVMALERGWTIDVKEGITTECLPDVLATLQWFYEHTAGLAATPPPTAAVVDPKAPPKKRRPKPAKPATPKPVVHPSHYPDAVTKAPPPPPVEGGYPTDLGIWESTHQSRDRDEYGPKGKLI